MSDYTHELFLLTVNLTQYTSRDLVIKVFVESLNAIFKSHSFYWSEDENEMNEEALKVATRTKQYGCIKQIVSGTTETDIKPLLQNAVQMLAVLLEKLEQEQLLKNQKDYLNRLVVEQTKMLLTKQTELQKKVDGFEALNEELRERNEDLQEAKRLTEDNEKRYSFLAQTAIELVELTSIHEIYVYTTQKINQLLNNHSIICLAALNDEEKQWKIHHIEGWEERSSIALSVLGFDLAQADGFLSVKYAEKIISGNLVELDVDFAGLLNNTISEETGRSLKEQLSIDKLYCVSFQQNSKIKGVVFFNTNSETGDADTELIKAFVKQVSVFLQKQKAEEELKKAKKRLQDISDNMLDLVSLTDLDGTYEFVGASHKVFGYEIESILGTNLMDYVHPDDLPQVSAAFSDFVSNKRPKAIARYRYLCADGSYPWFESIGRFICDDKGEPCQILFNTRDITERIKASEALRESEERYLAFINASEDMIFLKDDQFRYLVANNAIASFFGVTKEEMIGKTDQELACKTQIFPCISSDKKALEASEPFMLEEKLGNRFCETTKFPVLLKNRQRGIGGIIRDITQRKLTEDALIRSEKELRKAQEITHIGSWFLDVASNQVTWSEELYRMYGFNPQLPPPPYTEHMKLFTPSSWEILSASLAKTSQTGIPYELELKTVKKDGTNGWMWVRGEAVQDKQGNIVGLWGAAQDISERKRMEENLKESEERFKNMFEGHSAIMVLIDPISGLIIDANEAATRFYGYSKSEFPSLGIGKIFMIQPGHCVDDHIRSLKNEMNSSIALHKTADGKMRTVEVHSSPISFGNSQILFSIIHDITDRKMAEEALRRSEAVKNAMVSNIGDTIVIFGSDGINRYKSPNLTRLFGWQPHELVGKSTWDVVHPDDLDDAQRFIENLAAVPNATGTTQLRYRCKNGKYVWIEITVANLLSDPDIQGFLGNYKDITERKLAEEAQKQLEIAKNTALFKQNFLANMSHEIRTPLTGVLGMIEILEQTPLDANQTDYLHTIKSSGENLREIINQVLDFSKIEAGKISITPVVFAFRSLLSDSENLFKNILRENVEIIIKTDPALPAFIEADRFRLSQVLNNFISNGVKFTHKGSVTVTSAIKSSNPQDKEVTFIIEVADTGIGIPEDLQKKLFLPFSQIEDIDTRNYEGTGLGLSICKQLIDLMGGETGVNSIPGKGSTFWFTFPTRIAEAPAEKSKVPASRIPHPQLNILLVEDKVVNQKVITLTLNSLGHKVQIACNGRQALDDFKPGIFDLILMDIQMPIMDGITATRLLRENHTDLPPIIGLSANAFEGDKEKYMAYGMDEYLTKPVKKEDFVRLINMLVQTS
jgi:PAS domain S-box-containing protein